MILNLTDPAGFQLYYACLPVVKQALAFKYRSYLLLLSSSLGVLAYLLIRKNIPDNPAKTFLDRYGVYFYLFENILLVSYLLLN